MRPLVLMWKHKKEQKRDLIIDGICWFSKIGALAAGYTKEQAEEIGQYYHTAIYFPNIDLTFESVANVDISKFPKVEIKWQGARMTQGKQNCSEVYQFKRDITIEEYRAMKKYCETAVNLPLGYHFLQFFACIIIYPTRPLWEWLFEKYKIKPPLTTRFLDRCVDFVMNVFQSAGIYLLSKEIHPDIAIVGELIYSDQLEKE